MIPSADPTSDRLTCPECLVTLEPVAEWSGPTIRFVRCRICLKVWPTLSESRRTTIRPERPVAVRTPSLTSPAKRRDAKPAGGKSERSRYPRMDPRRQAVPAPTRPAAEVVAEKMALLRDLRKVHEIAAGVKSETGGE